MKSTTEMGFGVTGAAAAGGAGEQVAIAVKGEWLINNGPGVLSWTEVGQIIGIIYCSFLTIKMAIKAIVWIKDKIKSK